MFDNKHVAEICTMALDLLHASSYFKVPHCPSEIIQIRIGELLKHDTVLLDKYNIYF